MITIDESQNCHEVDLSKSADELQVLFATGIVNPNGPTFNVFYFDATSSSESKPLYQVNIHPISDSIQKVGSVIYSASERGTLKAINFFSDFFKGSLPTLFLQGNQLDKQLFNQIISIYINSTEDSLRTYQFVKKYEGKPYQRVSAEIREATKAILGKKSTESVGFFKKLFGKRRIEIDEIDIQDFIKTLTKDKNVLEEIKALLSAYSGSIENVIPAGMVKLNFKAFVEVFASVAIQCNVDLNKLRK
jgi:hypothetical protein